MTEATLVLAEVARRYRIVLADDSRVLPIGIVTTQPSRASCSALTHAEHTAWVKDRLLPIRVQVPFDLVQRDGVLVKKRQQIGKLVQHDIVHVRLTGGRYR